ncbi:unnamed protein product [Prorocentrum cordatum]|nr:unnamed protein product [Polarella glacialis]
MTDGANYKGDPASFGELTWEQILEKAEGAVFSVAQRGTSKRLTSLRTKAIDSVNEYKKEAQKLFVDLGADEFFTAAVQRIEEGARCIDTTLSECKIMHNIHRDNKTGLAQRQARVDEELTKASGTLAEGAVKLELHEVIKAKALEFMRA